VSAVDGTDFEQSEEILGIDRHNYWAIYIDLIEPPAAPPAHVWCCHAASPGAAGRRRRSRSAGRVGQV